MKKLILSLFIILVLLLSLSSMSFAQDQWTDITTGLTGNLYSLYSEGEPIGLEYNFAVTFDFVRYFNKNFGIGLYTGIYTSFITVEGYIDRPEGIVLSMPILFVLSFQFPITDKISIPIYIAGPLVFHFLLIGFDGSAMGGVAVNLCASIGTGVKIYFTETFGMRFLAVFKTSIPYNIGGGLEIGFMFKV